MKQHITPEQLNELSEKGKKNLISWTVLKGYTSPLDAEKSHPLLFIGQMIEFLDENQPSWYLDTRQKLVNVFFEKRGLTVPYGNKKLNSFDLCDALWEAVKEMLEA